MATTSVRVASLCALTVLLGCGGGGSIFDRPRGDWRISFQLLSETPEGCGVDIQESLRGEVVDLSSTRIQLTIYFEETDGCNARGLELRGDEILEDTWQMDDVSDVQVCQLLERYGLQDLATSMVQLEMPPDRTILEVYGGSTNDFGSEQCSGVLMINGWNP